MKSPSFDLPQCSGATAARLQKRALRQALLARRDALPQAARVAIGRAVCSFIAGLPAFPVASALLLFYPVGSELDLLPLAKLANERRVPVGFPVCRGKELFFRQATANEQLLPGAYGIPVPPESAPVITPDRNTICVVPALGYDQSFCRIGYGGGFYDRFLKDFPGVSVGICPEELIVESVFAEPHDLPVDLLVTETRVLQNPNPRKNPGF